MKIRKSFPCLFLAVLMLVALVNSAPLRSFASTGSGTNEILQDTVTQIVSDSPGYRVKITVTYTYRYESSNSSQRYITGILKAEASMPTISLWHGVKKTASVTGVVYGNNRQVAHVNVKYYPNIGNGDIPCYGIVDIDTRK